MDFSHLTNRRRTQGGFTLAEGMIGLALGLFIATTLAAVMVYFFRNSSFIAGHVTANAKDRISIEVVGREIREAESFLKLNPTNMVMRVKGQPVELKFDAREKRLYHITPQHTRLLLLNCQDMRFSYLEPRIGSTTLENYQISTSATCRVVQMSWNSAIPSGVGRVATVSNSIRFMNRRPIN
mgnify:FL=1